MHHSSSFGEPVLRFVTNDIRAVSWEREWEAEIMFVWRSFEKLIYLWWSLISEKASVQSMSIFSSLPACQIMSCNLHQNIIIRINLYYFDQVFQERPTQLALFYDVGRAHFMSCLSVMSFRLYDAMKAGKAHSLKAFHLEGWWVIVLSDILIWHLKCLSEYIKIAQWLNIEPELNVK